MKGEELDCPREGVRENERRRGGGSESRDTATVSDCRVDAAVSAIVADLVVSFEVQAGVLHLVSGHEQHCGGSAMQGHMGTSKDRISG